jgi:hypothetical protein
MREYPQLSWSTQNAQVTTPVMQLFGKIQDISQSEEGQPAGNPRSRKQFDGGSSETTREALHEGAKNTHKVSSNPPKKMDDKFKYARGIVRSPWGT